jgi:stress response protein SCP2
VVDLVRGQRVVLAALAGGEPEQVYLGVRLGAGGAGGLDVVGFGLDAAGRLSDERWFVFYNQPSSPDGAVELVAGMDGDAAGLLLRLDRVPEAIGRIMVTVSVDPPATMGEVADGRLRLVGDGRELATYAFARSDFSSERAVILGEVYRRGGWRMTSTGQGFDGGLAALIETFGGEVAAEPAPAATPAPAPAPAPALKRPSGPAPRPPVSAAAGGICPWGMPLPVVHPSFADRPVWGVPVR